MSFLLRNKSHIICADRCSSGLRICRQISHFEIFSCSSYMKTSIVTQVKPSLFERILSRFIVNFPTVIINQSALERYWWKLIKDMYRTHSNCQMLQIWLRSDVIFTHQLFHSFFIKIHASFNIRYIFRPSEGTCTYISRIRSRNEKMIFHPQQWKMKIHNIHCLRTSQTHLCNLVR